MISPYTALDSVWKRWKVKHHWEAPRKFLCKSHSFFYSWAVPPNEQTREMLSTWQWGFCLVWGCLFAFGFFFQKMHYILQRLLQYYVKKCRLLIISSIIDIVIFNNLMRKYWLIVHEIHNTTGTGPCSFKENKLGKQTARQVSNKKKVLYILGHKL